MKKYKKTQSTYYGLLKDLKQSIIKSRYVTASLANRELLLLYLQVGKRLSEEIEKEKWGAKVLHEISRDLQADLPGLRGFSMSSLKKMRQFSFEYLKYLIGPLPTAQLQKSIGPLPTAQLKKKKNQSKAVKKAAPENKIVVPESFFEITFTHHISLMNKCKELSERFYYMDYVSSSFLTVKDMESVIRGKYFKKKGKLPNNFKKTMNENLTAAALDIFRSDYFLDFMSEDDVTDEKNVESKMINNLKKFILTMGKGFAFIGNQHRIEGPGKEGFLDLIFFNRILRCLVVAELKKGEFKPEHAGKLNYNIGIIDEKMKLPHENPTIGIILCRAKNDLVVEYSIRDINKSMGVATYTVTKKRPDALSKVLPPSEKLIQFLEDRNEPEIKKSARTKK